MADSRAYFDHAATTPLDPRVLEAMLPYLTTSWGNPSSIYAEGREAAKGLDLARRKVAEILNCKPAEVIFTSGGSEADNSAVRGAAYGNRRRGNHIITTAIEHHAILHAAERLEQEDFRVTYLPVDSEGFISLDDLDAALTDETTLVSIMYANNEIGTIEPVPEAASLVKARNPHTVVHSDTVQAAGYLDLDVERLRVDMLTLAAHKFYGPRGIGVLYVRQRTPFQAQVVGGSQERSRRAGTENVAGAVGLARALELAYAERDERVSQIRAMRDYLLREIPERVPGVRITGPMDLERRLPGNLSLCFERLEGEPVLLQLDLNGFSASSGSACTTGSMEPSHVLSACGIDVDTARGSLRLSLGKDNTMEQCRRLVEILPGIVEKLRRLQPTYRDTQPASASTGA
ncbi:MAG TPA: cysteine desulfurase family protein [Dehalococcoidia bacterium]|nr:cysteine desulfurase family protein [Dehalococcoidia bacterium]